MWEKIEWLVDVAFKALVVLYAFYRFLKAKVEKKRIERTANKEDIEIQKNAEKQREKEEELKTMAKFLCDRCGAECDVTDAKRYESDDMKADVCEACFNTLKERDEKIVNAKANVEAAEMALREAKEELLRLTGGNVANSNEMSAIEQSTKEEGKAAILHKLGI